MLETLFSHTVPQLFASVISIILIATGMFFYNWQLALALFGVVPVATTVIFLGKRLMDKANKEYYHVRRDTTEQIQEGLEAAQEIKSYNGEAAYCDRLDKQLEIYEATLQRGEFLGAVRERKLISYSIDVGKEKKDRKSIMFFQYPGDVKGTGFLTWDYDELNKDDDKWLYLPAIKKTRRISGSSAKQDYFMGSDFTYDDMGSRNVDEDTHTLLGEETVDGQKCWKLESLPKDKRDIYSRKTALIRQDCLIPVRVEYYDKMGKLHRRLEMSDIAKVEGFWVARKMHMTNVQTEHQTVLEIKNPTYNIPMEESKFNVTTLEKRRF